MLAMSVMFLCQVATPCHAHGTAAIINIISTALCAGLSLLTSAHRCLALSGATGAAGRRLLQAAPMQANNLEGSLAAGPKSAAAGTVGSTPVLIGTGT